MLRLLCMIHEMEIKRTPPDLKYRVRFYYPYKWDGLNGWDLKSNGIETVENLAKEIRYIYEIVIFLGNGNFIIWNCHEKEIRIDSEKKTLLNFLEYQPALFGGWEVNNESE